MYGGTYVSIVCRPDRSHAIEDGVVAAAAPPPVEQRAYILHVFLVRSFIFRKKFSPPPSLPDVEVGGGGRGTGNPLLAPSGTIHLIEMENFSQMIKTLLAVLFTFIVGMTNQFRHRIHSFNCRRHIWPRTVGQNLVFDETNFANFFMDTWNF